MWISPPFAQTAENSGFRVVLTLIASVMSAYAQNPPPLSLEQWWKPPPEQENGEGMKSHILKKSQILKTLMGFAKRCKQKSDAFNTPFKASLNLYSPTLMAQPLSTASFPALKKKLQLEFHKWMRQHLTMSASTPNHSWHSNRPLEFLDLLPLEVILNQIPEYNPYKTTLSIRSWKNICYVICISFSGSWKRESAVLGRVKNEEEAPDAIPVHVQMEECKLKILEYRHKKPTVPAGDGARQVLHYEVSWDFFYFLNDRACRV